MGLIRAPGHRVPSGPYSAKAVCTRVSTEMVVATSDQYGNHTGFMTTPVNCRRERAKKVRDLLSPRTVVTRVTEGPK